MALTAFDLPLRVTVLRPPPEVAFQMQRGRNELLPPTSFTDRAISFDVVLRVRGSLPGDRPNIVGPLAQGPPNGRFLYVNSGTRAGQRDSCWDRRAKIPLAGITWPLVREVNATPGAHLEAFIEGTAPDGGPACASVQLLEGGWRVGPTAAA